MITAPLLTNHQWHAIERYLPPKKHNRAIISAVVFRNWSGESLRHVAQWYGCTFGRLQAWDREMRAGGQLSAIMRELRLPQASSLMWSNGGQRSSWRDPDTARKVEAYRFGQFKEALREA
jgi:hypothetical protein